MMLELKTSSYGTLLTYPVARLSTLHLVSHNVFKLNGKHFHFSLRNLIPLFSQRRCGPT